MGSKAVLMAPLLINEFLKNKVDKNAILKDFQKINENINMLIV